MIWDKIQKRMTYDELNKFTFTSLQGGVVDETKLKESTYFKCIKYLSESIAKCPITIRQETENGEIEAKNHRLYTTLRLRPNESMSAVDAIKSFAAIAEHDGVGGLYIDRNTNQLYPCKIVKVTIDDVGLLKSKLKNKVLFDIDIVGKQYSALEKDVILFKAGMSFDGITTTSTGELLSQTISTTQKAQTYLSQTFDNGLTNKLVVQLTSDVKDEKELGKIQSKFDRLFSNNGRTFTVPAGYSVNALNLSLSDAQFEQLRKLSRREIANAFGLSPAIIGDLEDSNNNNMEMQNIHFLVDTLLIKIVQIEQEMDYKLLTEKERLQGYKIRFNTNVMLRTNAKEQAEILDKYVSRGIYTVNDARLILGKLKIEGFDEPYLPSGSFTASQINKQIADKGGTGGE